MKFGYGSIFQYYCTSCGKVLRETSSQINNKYINEECIYCGESLQQTLEKRSKGAPTRTRIKFQPQFCTAIDSQINIDIPSLKPIIPSIQFGYRMCIIDKSHIFISEFLPRFKVMAIRQEISSCSFCGC